MKKEEENHNDHVKDNGDHNKNEKLVTGTDHEPKQTLQSKNVEVELPKAKSTWRELKSWFLFSDSLLWTKERRRERKNINGTDRCKP